MSDRDFSLVYIAVIVLLPMVPAIALFKLLPSRATVKGPFKGLRINLGGAFAAYFIVLLLLLGFSPTPPQSQNTQVWRVTGTVRFSDQDGVPVNTVRLSLVPPPERIASDGTFNIKVFATMSDGGKLLELPDLLVEASGYQPVSQSLENDRWWDLVKHSVAIKKPIELSPKPDQPYRAAKPLQADGVSQ